MEERNGTIHVHDTHIGIWEEQVDEKDFWQVYAEVIRFLRSRGFKVGQDKRIKQHYPILSPSRRHAYKNRLEAKIEISGRVVKIDFFQNVVFENRSGGAYDFDKYTKMPYLIKMQYLLEASRLIKHLVERYGYTFSERSLGCPNRFLPSTSTVERVRWLAQGRKPTSPLARFNMLWGKDRFERFGPRHVSWGWPIPSECGSSIDAEGRELRPYDTRYFRDRFDGRIRRVRVFPNMNSMWTACDASGSKAWSYEHASHFFSRLPADFKKRVVPEGRLQIRLEQELKKAVSSMDFERAAVLREVWKRHGFNLAQMTVEIRKAA